MLRDGHAPLSCKHDALKKILVLCPTRREYLHLPVLAGALGCEVVFDDFGGDYFDAFLGRHPPADPPPLDILRLVDDTAERCRRLHLSGVTSGVGYPGMSGASLIARALDLPGPSPESVICCEHKYYSRVAQKAIVPEAVPEFALIDPRAPRAGAPIGAFPVFLKPVKSCMSMNARAIADMQTLREVAPTALLPEGFVAPFNDLLRRYTRYPLDASYLLVESLLEGTQVSLEGYVHCGEVHVMGILDAVMFPGTISFKRFRYPSQLSESVQARMKDIARRMMSGIAYDNAPFNMELMYDPRRDRIHIIEVNPKIASQFTDLFTKVDGCSSFSVLLELAMGERPRFEPRRGEFKIAASCVLRTFEDQRVVAIPSQAAIDRVTAAFPDAIIEIHATPGRNLSDQMQDAGSFRYGLVNIGANSEGELEAKFAAIARELKFEFEPRAALCG